MKWTYILVFVVSCVGPVYATAIVPSSPCAAGAALATYMQDVECSVGPITFSNFYFTGAAVTGTASLLTPDQVTVVPFVGRRQVGFIFTGPFSVSKGASVLYTFGFDADPRPPILHGFSASLSLTRSAKPLNGAATLYAEQCLNDKPTGPCEATDFETLYYRRTGSLLNTTHYFKPVQVVMAHSTLILDGTTGAMTLHSIAEGVHIVPEPSSFPLFAWGGVWLLLGVSWRRLRRYAGPTIP